MQHVDRPANLNHHAAVQFDSIRSSVQFRPGHEKLGQGVARGDIEQRVRNFAEFGRGRLHGSAEKHRHGGKVAHPIALQFDEVGLGPGIEALFQIVVSTDRVRAKNN